MSIDAVLVRSVLKHDCQTDQIWISLVVFARSLASKCHGQCKGIIHSRNCDIARHTGTVAILGKCVGIDYCLFRSRTLRENP